jgi:cytochrome c553
MAPPLLSAEKTEPKVQATSTVRFDRDIRPVLVRACFRCHGPDEQQREAELDLSERSSAISERSSGKTAIVPGQVEQSELIRRIVSRDPEVVMPPPDAGVTVSDDEKRQLSEWIARGADYDQHWAFRRPQKIEPPATIETGWARNSVDRFILHQLEQQQLAPASAANPQQLVRRLYLDVVGVPPEPAQTQAFVDDPSPEAWDRLVDQLLDDPRYGERWAKFWLDLARYADTAGYEGDPEYPHAWRYRDYVIDALNSDKPYSDFIREQIAGDELVQITGAGELIASQPEHLVALTFLRLAPFTEPRGDETRDQLLSEMTSTVGSVFLGLTVGCAKCHDHKYDQIPSRDFYRLKGFFASVQIPPPLPGDGFQLGGSLPAAFYRPDEESWAESTRRHYDEELQKTRKQLDELTQTLAAALSAQPGKATSVSADDIRKIIRDGKGTENGLDPDSLRRYAEFEQYEYHCRNSLRRLQPVAMSLRHSFGPPYEPGMPATHVLTRGEYNQPAEVVAPGFLTAVTGEERPAPYVVDPYHRWPTRGWRKLLADWIASPDNPLTARVMVNRLWHHHFGRGLVATTSDFGTLGTPPSHPELLDWLAIYLVENQWSLKSIHRLILKSSTWRQSSVVTNAAAEAVDPDNQLLWRFPRRRLDAEAIRDSMLAVSGQLNSQQFGLPVFPPLPEDLADVQKVQGKNRWETQHGPEGRRRSVYIFQRRSLNVPMLDVLDSLVPNTSCAQRRSSVTSLQALELYNGAFTNQMAVAFAERVRSEAGADYDDQIRRAFVTALCRLPSDDELNQFRTLAQKNVSERGSTELSGMVRVCRVLLNCNEFLYPD